MDSRDRQRLAVGIRHHSAMIGALIYHPLRHDDSISLSLRLLRRLLGT